MYSVMIIFYYTGLKEGKRKNIQIHTDKHYSTRHLMAKQVSNVIIRQYESNVIKENEMNMNEVAK